MKKDRVTTHSYPVNFVVGSFMYKNLWFKFSLSLAFRVG